MNALEVADAARHAVGAIHAGQGPVFLEMRTYRFRAHSMFDPELYRDKAEVAQWKTRDPITHLKAHLEASGALTGEAFQAIEAGVDAEVAAAVAFAETGTWEPVSDLTKDVCTPWPA
jgi:TPP-dependent pyruvate/acetoin dehydrogenase alpha subunit